MLQQRVYGGTTLVTLMADACCATCGAGVGSELQGGVAKGAQHCNEQMLWCTDPIEAHTVQRWQHES